MNQREVTFGPSVSARAGPRSSPGLLDEGLHCAELRHLGLACAERVSDEGDALRNGEDWAVLTLYGQFATREI